MCAAPILARSRWMFTTTTRGSPQSALPHTCASNCSRPSTSPAWSSSTSSSRNSVALNCTGSPALVSVLPARSMTRSPDRSCRGPPAGRLRSSARNRAASTSESNGFTT